MCALNTENPPCIEGEKHEPQCSRGALYVDHCAQKFGLPFIYKSQSGKRPFTPSESANFTIFGCQNGQEKDNNSHFYIRWSGLEIRTDLYLNLGLVNNHSPLQGALISPFLVTKKGQEKDNNSRFYIHQSRLEIQTDLHLINMKIF